MNLKGYYQLNQKIPGTRLTPIERVDGSRALTYKCKCDCGNITLAIASEVDGGRKKSCGCFRRELSALKSRTHGLSKTPEYFASHNAIRRCRNPKDAAYNNYGGRGITVSFKDIREMAEWLIKFLPKKNPKTVLDRIDNSRGYEPGNLRWATCSESANNQRNNRQVTILGVTKTITQWEKVSGVSSMTIHSRIKRNYPEELWLHVGKITKKSFFDLLDKNKFRKRLTARSELV